MSYLCMAILCGAANHLLFKEFERRRVRIFPAISVNYLVCVLIGFTSNIEIATGIPLAGQTWFYYSIVQGIMFIISVFYMMSVATRKNGIAIAALSTRLAVVIPTVLAFFLYGDSIHMMKLVGIAFALFALFLSSFESGAVPRQNQKWIRLIPPALFLMVGIHLSFTKFVQEYHLNDDVYHAYVMSSTAYAFLVSVIVLGFRMIWEKTRPGLKDIIAGIILGVNNYGALYFLFRTIGQKGWQSSVVFPTLSVAIVILSFTGGYVIFKEDVSQQKMIALGFGIVGIVLINAR